MLSLRNDVVQSGGAGLGPHVRLVSDDVEKLGDGGLLTIKDASVLVLPKPPGSEDDERGQTLARRGWRTVAGRLAPGEEASVTARDVGGGANPIEDPVLYLARRGSPPKDVALAPLLDRRRRKSPRVEGHVELVVQPSSIGLATQAT